MSPLEGWQTMKVWFLRRLATLKFSVMWPKKISKQRYLVHKSPLHLVHDVCSDEWVLVSRSQEAAVYKTDNITTENFAQNIGYRSLAFGIFDNCCLICSTLVMAHSGNTVSSDISCASSGRWMWRYKCFASSYNCGNTFLYTKYYLVQGWRTTCS